MNKLTLLTLLFLTSCAFRSSQTSSPDSAQSAMFEVECGDLSGEIVALLKAYQLTCSTHFTQPLSIFQILSVLNNSRKSGPAFRYKPPQ